MATAAPNYAAPDPPAANDAEDEGDRQHKTPTKDWPEVHARALRRFDDASGPQADIRAHSLLCRRFISIPGAMWEGAWGEQFANSIKVEIDKLSKGVDKIVEAYRANRIVPDFRPAGGDADEMTADTLDGVHRADGYRYKSQQARDNAFEEAAAGGFGAYRLVNDYEDEDDPDNDYQRINPGLLIADADQRVYFDPNAKLYDKADAQFGFVLTADSVEAFEAEWEGKATDFPVNTLAAGAFDWFPPDVVIKAEYYEIEDVAERLLTFTHSISGQEQRVWQSEIETHEIRDLTAQGWRKSEQKRQRKRVHKYVMSGAEILEDCGLIAGPNIPIVPVYGKRWFVDNQERFRGYVSKLMDAQRIYNGKVSKLAETDALSPREKPIFLAEQMPPHLRDLWAKQEQERHPYALVNPVIDPATGQIVAMGPIGKIEPPQLNPVAALLMQVAGNDLAEAGSDGAEQVVANTSAEAMDIASTRTDSKSAIYLDNMRQSVQREGEIYLGMAKEIYFEPGRIIETMNEEGADGEAKLQEPATTKTGRFLIRNDFQKGRYKVVVGVTEATTTRRDKTVKASLKTAEVAMLANDPELAQAAIITAVMNQDGEGMDQLQAFARRKGLSIGLVEPTEAEAAAMKQAAEAEGEKPDPTQMLVTAQAAALGAQAQKDSATAGKTEAETRLARAKTVDTLATAAQTRAETLSMGAPPTVELEGEEGGPAPPADSPEGLLPGALPIEPPQPQRVRRGYEAAPPAGP
jgi:hypothetical protein